MVDGEGGDGFIGYDECDGTGIGDFNVIIKFQCSFHLPVYY